MGTEVAGTPSRFRLALRAGRASVRRMHALVFARSAKIPAGFVKPLRPSTSNLNLPKNAALRVVEERCSAKNSNNNIRLD